MKTLEFLAGKNPNICKHGRTSGFCRQKNQLKCIALSIMLTHEVDCMAEDWNYLKTVAEVAVE